jgi:hypothetical protein
MGTAFNHRMVDLTTYESVLGRGIGWRLPDGRRVNMAVTRGRPRNRSCEIKDENGMVVLRLKWMPPAAPWRGHCPVATAELLGGIEPTDDLIPLLAYAFQWFGYACQYKGGG